jgi:ATP-binding cassette subfamily B protein/subfamily B ATP-binding cassette protein MsbA
MSVHRRALAYFRPNLAATVVAMVLTLVGNAFNLLRPWPLAFIVDKLLPASANGTHGLSIWGHDLGGWSLPTILMIVCSLMVVLHILAGGIGYVTSIITLRVGLHAILRMRTELYAYLHSLPLKFHDERRSSDSSFRVAYDSQSIQSIYSRWF